jgi:hypothetical protein
MQNEQSVLVHWYYSVSEWQEFMNRENKKRNKQILRDSLLIGILGMLILHYIGKISWVVSFIIACNLSILCMGLKYYFRKRAGTWRDKKMPEVTIMDDTAMINGKQLVFHGQGKWLRKADIKEKNNVNVLEITYEWHTRKGAHFDEIRVPVPRGKLREAVELLDCLNLRRTLLSGLLM